MVEDVADARAGVVEDCWKKRGVVEDRSTLEIAGRERGTGSLLGDC